MLVNGYICLREGQLEQLVTRKNTKEHEAIIAVDADARKIHEALNLAGAVEGNAGALRADLSAGHRADDQGEHSVRGQGPARHRAGSVVGQEYRTGKPLDVDWVFAGSGLVDNPLDPDHPKTYLANDGDVICVSNFDTAMLDLPVESSKNNDDLLFEAWTDRIPPLDTNVVVILEPVPTPKKDKAP